MSSLNILSADKNYSQSVLLVSKQWLCRIPILSVSLAVSVILSFSLDDEARAQSFTCSAADPYINPSSSFNSISIEDGCLSIDVNTGVLGQSITANSTVNNLEKLFNSGTIKNLVNTGYIRVNTPLTPGHGFGNVVNGTISNFTNSGTINGYNTILNYTNSNIFYLKNYGSLSSLNYAIENYSSSNISYILNDGTIYGTNAAVNSTDSTIGIIENNGDIQSQSNAINNSNASIFNIYNNGTISGNNNAIFNGYGAINNIVNNNNMTSSNGVVIANTSSSQILSITNNGTMSGFGTVIDNVDSTIGKIVNNGLIQTAAGTGAAAIYNGGINASIGSISNYGTIYSDWTAIDLVNGNIGSIYNDSSAQILAGDYNASSVGNGAISLGGNAETVTIGTITNFGNIAGGYNHYGIFNYECINLSCTSVYGSIGTLNNYQGTSGSGSTALTLKGGLPSSYNIIVNQTHYGQLQVTNAISPNANDPTAKMNFGLYSGSTLAYLKQRYGSVLSSTDGSLDGKIANFSGSTSSGRKWRLIDNGDGTYDLEIDGYIVVSKVFSSLQSNRDALLGAMHERYAVLNAVSQYDCNRFDKYGLCISMQSRATGWGSQTTGAGVLNIAYRPHPNVHAGVYLDYQVAQATPFGTNLGSGGIQYGYNNPTFGGYVGFSQSGYNGTPVNAGLQAFVSGGYNPGKVTVTRAMLDGTEPGQGTAGLNAYYAYGTLGYGFKIADQTTIAPYAGLFYTNVIRNAYQEQLNLLVQSPLGYNAFYEQLLTGVVGGRVQSMITDKLGANVGAGAQFDLTRNANSYSGYSYVSGMEAYGIAHGGAWNGARPTGQAGVFYNVTKNEQLLLNAYAGQQAYTTRTYTSLVAGYQVSF